MFDSFVNLQNNDLINKRPVFLEYQVYFSWLKFKVFTILLSYLVFLST